MQRKFYPVSQQVRRLKNNKESVNEYFFTQSNLEQRSIGGWVLLPIRQTDAYSVVFGEKLDQFVRF